MDKLQQQALQVTKEITVKFIEIGRISPSNFAEVFDDIYKSVLSTIADGEDALSRIGGEDKSAS
jgi:hypothetical protein